jgi:hypothetical protein
MKSKVHTFTLLVDFEGCTFVGVMCLTIVQLMNL